MSFADVPRMEFYFDNRLTPPESMMQADDEQKPLLYKVIDEITYMGQKSTLSGGSANLRQTSPNLMKAFRLAGPQRYRTLGCFVDDRPNAPNVVLLLSTGQTNEPKDAVIQVPMFALYYILQNNISHGSYHLSMNLTH